MKALADNDVVLKGACYGLLAELCVTLAGDVSQTGVLGVAKFVVSRAIRKKTLRTRSTEAVRDFEAFLSQARLIEPTDAEQMMAADFESIAQRLGLALDNGESLLCAISICRDISKLSTGDKRAIESIEVLLGHDRRLGVLTGRIYCLEQLVRQIVGDVSRVKCAICAEPDVDKALTICCSCRNQDATDASFFEGLQSYTEDLRLRASKVLAN